MQIRSVDTFVLKLDVEEPYLGGLADGSLLTSGAGYTVRSPWRSLYSARFETMLVRITAEDGTAGWGEALAPVGPEIPAAVVDRLLAPQLVGATLTGVRPLWQRLRDLMRERGHLDGHQADALAAVDIALWDLHGRLLRQPVHALLGGAYRTHVPAYVSGLPRPRDDERVALAREWSERGASAIKLHLGHGVAADLATFDAVAAAVPQMSLAVDAHWAYDMPDAIRLGRALDERGALFYEAPLAPEDITGHSELTARLTTPVAIGETLRHRYAFDDWLTRRALRLAQPDVGRTGITEAMVIAELAAARHVPIAPHHSVGLGVALAAGLHVCAAAERLAWFEFQPTTCAVADRILRTALPAGPTGFVVPDEPGLGITVDTDFVTAHAVRP